MSSAHGSPSPPSPRRGPSVLDDLQLEDLGMGINIDLDLTAQNGDARRAAEDDILIDIDELVGPSDGALPLLHEFEEAWGDDTTDSNRPPEYPASPEPSGSESGSRAAARFTSPVPIASSHHRRQLQHHPYPNTRRGSALQRTAGSPSPSSFSPRRSPFSPARAESPSVGTPGRMYCPGISVPMHRPQSREGAYGEERAFTPSHGIPRIVVSRQLPSTPPRTPSPSPLSSGSRTSGLVNETQRQTPQAELDALIVPGAAVSESPTPAMLLLPSETRLAPDPTEETQSVVASGITEGAAIFGYPMASLPASTPAPLPLGQQQLGQIVIPTLQPLNPPICATFVDGM